MNERKTEVVNARVSTATLDWGDRLVLIGDVHFDYGGKRQGLGGYVLDSYDKESDCRVPSKACGLFVSKLLQTLEVHEWSFLPDTPCRVERVGRWNGDIIAVGHFIKDKWFRVQDEFAALAAEPEGGRDAR